MKHIKKISIAFILSMSLVIPSNLPIFNTTVAVVEAASPKLSASKLTLEVGKSKTLTLKNTKKTPTWKSSKKTVATVNKNGKVTAKAPGTTTITATLSGTKYTCKVTVKKAANPALKNAPFKAVEFNYSNLNMVVPATWLSKLNKIDTAAESLSIDPNGDGLSYIEMTPILNEEKISYKEFITSASALMSKELLTSSISQVFDVPAEISDYKVADLKANKLAYRRFSFKVDIPDLETSYHQSIYMFLIGDYAVTIGAMDMMNDYKTSPLIQEVEYVISSIQVSK